MSYYKTEIGLLRNRFSKFKYKSKLRGHTKPLMTFESFKSWCYKKGYKNLFRDWADSDYKTELSPSVDRINPNIGYTFENMRLTTWFDNSKYNHYHRKNKTLNNKVMPVKLSKLWGTSKFTKLSTNSKFIYLYLTTHNNLSVLGVLNIPMELMSLETGLEVSDIRYSCTELIQSGYINVKGFNDEVYFIVPAHFNVVPKSDSSVLKITKELKQLPEGLVAHLDTLGINVSRKVVKFIEPTVDEVMEYALEQGYQINAQVFIDYYRNKGKEFGKDGLWLNWKGKQVKDWKATARNVWFKDENKLKTVDGAPKGFESFYINFEGQQVFPESWKKGMPHSKNIAVKNALIREYEKRKGNS